MPARQLPLSAVIGLAVLGALVLPGSSAAVWKAGRGADASGLAYLAVVNATATGERVEVNCTPAGQAFFALSWGAAGEAGEGALTLRFLVDHSYRFVAPARYRPLDRGWAAAELDTPDILGPLTEALSVGGSAFEVEARAGDRSLVQAVFDMAAAPENFARFRAYCHM